MAVTGYELTMECGLVVPSILVEKLELATNLKVKVHGL